MNTVVEKLSSYQIINNFIPGFLLVFLSNTFLNINLFTDKIIVDFFITYILGVISSRVASLFIEKIYQILKLIKKTPYEEFINAEKDPKVNILSETNNFYRNILGAILVYFSECIYKFLMEKFSFINRYSFIIIPIILFIIFTFSYKKQTCLLKKRIEEQNSKNE